MNKLIEELKWRGMLQDIMPGTEEQLNKGMTTAYIGFDPTAESLHIGGMVQILLLVHLQKAGHKPLALVGGATGMVGDPSGKSAERNLLSEDVLQKNLAGIQKQLEKFLNFESSLPNAAEIVNNYDWFKPIGFLDFIRDVGKHITVNYMMAKDSVKKRIEGDSGISFTEFTYQLIQGYDYYWLYNHKNCRLQMGGSDQWGNIVTGTELIRRKSGGEAFGFTSPLITKSDGSKFGKSEAGNIWLDAEKTSPYQFYQFWVNASDADAATWINIFTFLDKKTIEGIIEKHNINPGERLLQKTLAKEITLFVHGADEYQKAIDTTAKLFAAQNAAAEDMGIDDLNNLEGIIKKEIDKNKITAGIDVISLVADTEIFSSRGEARKMLQNGGLSINRKKITDVQEQIDNKWLLHNQYLLIQKGKKNYYLVKTV